MHINNKHAYRGKFSINSFSLFTSEIVIWKCCYGIKGLLIKSRLHCLEIIADHCNLTVSSTRFVPQSHRLLATVARNLRFVQQALKWVGKCSINSPLNECLCKFFAKTPFKVGFVVNSLFKIKIQLKPVNLAFNSETF